MKQWGQPLPAFAKMPMVMMSRLTSSDVRPVQIMMMLMMTMGMLMSMMGPQITQM